MPTEARSLILLRKLRWPRGVRCVWCSTAAVVRFGSQCDSRRYRCKKCHRTFTDKTGTIFENSKLEVREWFYLAHELQKGRSINAAAADLGRSYEPVMHAAHKIMEGTFMKRLIALDAEDVEVDEMYIAAGEKGEKKEKPRKRGLKLRGRGTYAKDKPPILAAVARNGNAVIEVCTKLCKASVDAALFNLNARFVHTDDYALYAHLGGMGLVHTSVNHSEREYKVCYAYTNTVEGLYQGLRHFLDEFKGIRRRNLRLFVSLFQFNYNYRELEPLAWFEALLSTVIMR